MLIGNIFFNDINEEITSGYFFIDIILSEHLVQFLITPNVLENKPNKLIHKTGWPHTLENPENLEILEKESRFRN